MEKVLTTLNDFVLEAKEFIDNLVPRKYSATLITLSGELGAGKTTFTKAVAKTLGIKDMVTSPTFVVEKVYDIPLPSTHINANFSRFVHIDAYRLERGVQLSALRFHERMKDPKNLIFLEWPEKVSDILPVPHTQISISVLQNGSRTISYAKQ